MVKLTDGVYAYVQEKGTMGISNAGLVVSEKQALIVDTLTSIPHTEAFLKEVRVVTNKSIQYLVTTHHHPDHCWGNHLLPEAISICHKDCREAMKQMGQPDLSKFTEHSRNVDFSGVRFTLSDVTFDTALTIYLGSREIRVLHYGHGHTIGDAIVFLPEERVVFCGDLIFLYSTPMGVGASFSGWINTLSKIAELDAAFYVPGHGPLCGRDGLLLCREYLTLIYNEARKAFDAGVSSKEAAIHIPLGKFKYWAEPERVILNVNTLYREFSGEDLTTPIDIFAQMKDMREMVTSGTFHT